MSNYADNTDGSWHPQFNIEGSEDEPFEYRATHQSVRDGSTAMLLRETAGILTLVNEDGFEWVAPADRWEPYPYAEEVVL